LYLELVEPEQAEHYMRKAQEIWESAGIDPNALMVLPTSHNQETNQP
jgi:hypothetical protein